VSRRVLTGLALVATLVAGCLTTRDVLVGPTWSLREAGGSPPAADAGVQFDADGTFAATTGCNSLSGTYHLEGNRILIDSEQMSLSPCDPVTGPQEALVLEVLHAQPTYAIDTGTGHLRLTTDDDDVLVFAPQ
jgi:heat shock protein HslJ